MRLKLFLLTILVWLNFAVAPAQTSGLIYKPVNGLLGQKVLDPNGDGFTSLTYAGFTSNDYGTESELKMVGLPVLTNEPLSDVTTGPSGGHTDISNNGAAQSVYILVKNVDGVDYLIVRFRIGSASTAPKGYSLLLDTDNNFSNNYTSSNPGFEREVILEAGKRVRIYSHSASGETVLQTYDVNTHHQRSIAMSTGSGNADYFYDFFVPYDAINITGPVRMAAATITSAQSGISGTTSDFNGINDSAYGGNKAAIMAAVINSFPPVQLSNITEGFTFPAGVTLTPSIYAVTTSSSAITGTSLEPTGTTITIYRNGTQVGTTTVNSSNTWSLSTAGLNLQLGDFITATATASPKTVSSLSQVVQVTSAQGCNTPAPVISYRSNGSQSLTGTWSNGSAITANNVRIRVYYQNPSTGAFVEEYPNNTYYVTTAGTWTMNNLGNNTQTVFAARTYYVTATIGTATATTADDCTSILSNGIAGNGSSGTITTTPNVATTTITASTGSTNVSVKNNLAAAATLYLYVNGIQVQSASVAANATHIFSYSGFLEGDVVSARAKGNATGYILSNLSNQVTVTTTASATAAPVLNGPYVAGTQTVKGTSTEAPGTVITLYINGVATTNTTTVDTYGNWQFTNIALTAGQVISVRAKATGKAISGPSNTFTVGSSAPAAPTVTGPIFVPTAATASISGTGGSGTVTVYIDGTPIGTTTGSSWTLSGIDAAEIFRGGVVTATNTNTTTGIRSAHSAGVTIQGVVSFLITDINDNPIISEKKSGELFQIKITAKSGPDGTGSTYTNFTGKVVVSSDAGMLVGGGQTLNFVNGVLTHTIALGEPGLGRYVFVINTNDPTAFGIRTLNMVEAIWEGSVSTDYSVAANWVYNFVPEDGATIRFAEPTFNHCVLDQDRILGSISNNQTAYNLDLNGYKLKVNGNLNFANNAKINATAEGSTLSFTGKNPQELNSNLLIGQTLYGLESAGESIVTINGAVNLTGVLTLTSGNLNTQNNITMKSNAVRTAIVAPVDKGTITGNVVVERYFPAKRAYRFISSPVNTTTSINANWQEGVHNTGINYPADNVNPTPGFGTHITGSVTGANGLDATDTGNPSLYTHNNASPAWVAVNNTLTPTLTAGAAYRIMLRGDRSTDLSTNTPAPSATIIRTTGTLHTGNFTFTALNPAANGVSLVGNPYQAPVDIKTLLASSTNVRHGYYYIWDPTQSERGAYVTIDMTEADDLATMGQATRYVQPGQAFMVRTDAAGPASLTFTENLKQVNTATASVFRNGNSSAKIRMQLYENTAFETGKAPADGLIVKFSEEFSDLLDAMDAGKQGNQDENFAVRSNGKYLSIESRPMPTVQDTIHMFNNQYRSSGYVIKVQADAIAGVDAYLYDAYTEALTILHPGQTSLYSFTIDATIPASIATDRFKVVFEAQSLNTDKVQASSIVLYPNPTSTGLFNIMLNNSEAAEVTINNSLGQVVYSQKVTAHNEQVTITPANPLITGIYYVNVKQADKNYSQKLIVRN